MLTITIPPLPEPIRIDKFLASHEPFLARFETKPTRGDILRAIADGRVSINKKIVTKPNTLIHGEEEVFFSPYQGGVSRNGTRGYTPLSGNTPPPCGHLPLSREKTPPPREGVRGWLSDQKNIKILSENQHFLIIDKPARLQVHASHSEKERTLVAWLVANFPEIQSVGEDPERPGIVHRLDKDNSGVMIVARTQESFVELKKLFAERKIQKTYLALCHGIFKESVGVINKPIARAKNFRRQTIADSRRNYKGEVREAITEYRVIKKDFLPCQGEVARGVTHRDEVGRRGILALNIAPATHPLTPSPTEGESNSVRDDNAAISLIEARPQTGRMHQIRIHLASIGHPVIGDTLYAQKQFRNTITAPRQLLHAHKIEFELFGKRYIFESPAPEDFEKFLS